MGSMTKLRSQKSVAHARKYDILIRAKASSTEIDEVSRDSVEIESHSKGTVTGRLYSGIHWDTTEGTMMPGGKTKMKVKFLHITKTGEMIIGQGVGTQQAPKSNGIADVEGEAVTWTIAQRLSLLNGARWSFRGKYDMQKGALEVGGNIVSEGSADQRIDEDTTFGRATDEQDENGSHE